MTVIEQRFMESVPRLLGRICDELERANQLKELELKSRNVSSEDADPASHIFLVPAQTGGDA